MKPVATNAHVVIDFGRRADHAISHDRVALFNSGLVPATTYRRDRDYFAETHPEHLRIDLGWGAEWMPWTRELVTYVDGAAVYDFDETDEIASILNALDVRPYWSYSYVPSAVRRPGSDWRTMDDDDQGWVDLVRAYVVGARGRGVQIGYHEVYNEPDLRDERTAEAVFYAGELDDYLELYRRTATAIRDADPAARIGGPALASVAANSYWLRAFLDSVAAEGLPLDFLSFHHYGTFGLRAALHTVLSILDSYPQFAHVELHLNEYNSFTIDYPRGGLQDSFLLASAFAEDVEYLLGVPRVTRVSWAQFLDSGNDNYSGMITIDGAPKPLYWAYRFLQRMPLDRVHTSVDGPRGLGAIASGDDRGGAVIIYNRSSGDVSVSVEAIAQGQSGTITVIDSGHAGDQSVPLAGAFRLERGASALVSYGELSAPAPRRVVTRTRYDFSAECGGWADVDETTGSVRLGTGDETKPVRVGLDLPHPVTPNFLTRVFGADGAAREGELVLDAVPNDEGTTVWFTLTGAPAGTFASAHLIEATR